MIHEGTKTSPISEDIELLRDILERQQSRPVPYEEAVEVSESLIIFFEVLAQVNEVPS